MSEIEIRNLTKRFEVKGNTVTALNNVSMNIEKGDIYGIVRRGETQGRAVAARFRRLWRGRSNGGRLPNPAHGRHGLPDRLPTNPANGRTVAAFRCCRNRRERLQTVAG